MPRCIVEECQSPTRTKNIEFCASHYYANRRKEVLTRSTSCSTPDCTEPVWNASKELCQKHYKALWKQNRNKNTYRQCSIEGCTELHSTKGYCQSHYDKWRLHGDPLGGRQPVYIEDWESCLAVHLSGDLGDGKITLVSPEDRNVVEGHAWWLNAGGYAMCKIDDEQVLLHRLILGLEPHNPLQCDHINGERLDNRRENLRIVTYEQNMQNKKPWGKSGHRSVFFDEKKKLYRVVVVKDGKHHSGGRHKLLEDAIAAARTLRESLFSHHVEDRCSTPDTGPPEMPG